jgi:pimeloyl-ACP methyl ester carboxylesterase
MTGKRSFTRLGAVAIILMTVGCRSSGSSPPSTQHPSGSADGSRVVSRPCDTARSLPKTACYWLEVPENREVARSRTIRLWVAVIRERGATATSSTVLSLTGGPGDAASPPFVNGNLVFVGPPLNLVVVDQRGSGRSQPRLDCPALDVPSDSSTTWAHRLGAARLAAAACRDRYRASGIDIDGYNTVENAADLVDLRKALGVKQWVLDGTSYGGRLAQEVLRQDPTGVSGMVLDSPLTYAPQGPSTLIAGARDAIVRLGAACDAQPKCSSEAPDLVTTMARAEATLDAHPVPATIGDENGNPHKVSVAGQELVALVYAAQYDKTLIPQLPGALVATAAGDSSFITAAAKQASDLIGDRATGIYDLVTCADDAAGTGGSDRDLISDPGVYGTLLLSWPWPLCDAWGVAPVPEGRLFPASSNVPVLLQQGSLDPVSAPTWAAEITAHLTAATRVVFNGYGHEVSYVNQCAIQMTTRFLATPAEPIDATCARAPAPPFR